MVIASIFGIFQKKSRMPVEPVDTQSQDVENIVANTECTGKHAFLQEILKCDETKAARIADEFKEITGEEMEHVKEIPTEKNVKILEVSTPEKAYYLKVNSVNMLREIREDSVDGKLLMQIIY